MGDALIRGVVVTPLDDAHDAAAIEGYTLRRDKTTNTWTLQAVVILSDSFKMRQRPLVFEAPHQGGTWRWPLVEWTITAGVLSARLGPIEEVPCLSRVSSGPTSVH